ncbi:MAG: hypothetical protein CM15mP22_6410 [Gammaproteobacteria bacterium]|nr:MAG: hypothetical protein CM15mP22_6410 [Gammaproteobacteria bacterium]
MLTLVGKKAGSGLATLGFLIPLAYLKSFQSLQLQFLIMIKKIYCTLFKKIWKEVPKELLSPLLGTWVFIEPEIIFLKK